jgi:hypothetical protein
MYELSSIVGTRYFIATIGAILNRSWLQRFLNRQEKVNCREVNRRHLLKRCVILLGRDKGNAKLEWK